MQYLTDHDLAGKRGAHISDYGSWRYRLWREWERSRPTVSFLMLNPSTADHLTDDPTITRCLSRAISMKYVRLEAADLFLLHGTDPAELLTHVDPLGPPRTADSAVTDAIERAHGDLCMGRGPGRRSARR